MLFDHSYIIHINHIIHSNTTHIHSKTTKVRPILLQIAFMTVTTFLVVGIGIYMMTPLVPFLSEQATADCRISISLLLSSIMLARSPATAVAIISELGAKSASSKIMLGITVISDIVVLVSYDIVVGVTQVTCGNEHNHGVPRTFDANNLYFLLSEIGGSIVIGVRSRLINKNNKK